MKASMDAGKPVTLAHTQSIADGLMAVRPGDLNFSHVRTFVDEIVTVEDDEIARAVSWLFHGPRIVAEPSGAAAVAAALSIARFTPPVVAVISGGNVGPADLAKYTSVRHT
jgi:threonine dehydratase